MNTAQKPLGWETYNTTWWNGNKTLPVKHYDNNTEQVQENKKYKKTNKTILIATGSAMLLLIATIPISLILGQIILLIIATTLLFPTFLLGALILLAHSYTFKEKDPYGSLPNNYPILISDHQQYAQQIYEKLYHLQQKTGGQITTEPNKDQNLRALLSKDPEIRNKWWTSSTMLRRPEIPPYAEIRLTNKNITLAGVLDRYAPTGHLMGNAYAGELVLAGERAGTTRWTLDIQLPAQYAIEHHTISIQNPNTTPGEGQITWETFQQHYMTTFAKNHPLANPTLLDYVYRYGNNKCLHIFEGDRLLILCTDMNINIEYLYFYGKTLATLIPPTLYN